MKIALRAIRCSMRRCDDRPSFLFLSARLKLRRRGGNVIGSRWDRDDCRTLSSEGLSRAGSKEKIWAGCTHGIGVSWPMFSPHHLAVCWFGETVAAGETRDVALWWVTRELFDRKRPSRGGKTSSSVVLLSHSTLYIQVAQRLASGSGGSSEVPVH